MIIQLIMPPTHDCLKLQNYNLKHYIHIGLWLLLLCLQPSHFSPCFFKAKQIQLGLGLQVGELTFGGLYMVMFSLLEDKCHFIAKLQ